MTNNIINDFIEKSIYAYTNWDSEDEISACIAETNAHFPDEPEDLKINIAENGTTHSFVVHFQLKGEQEQDKSFFGDTIDVTVKGDVIMEEGEPEFVSFSVGASLRKDYLEEYEGE